MGKSMFISKLVRLSILGLVKDKIGYTSTCMVLDTAEKHAKLVLKEKQLMILLTGINKAWF
ncbi:hypothetical protein [Staphylothermus hellenicus]|uniref:Uncharacterized protein n=1 Tax=Staphylothermus hellenicus (strain DSM 12710 / JCM 10830 / BK20S6-10-b1 / P8) TaxID=591019 RepID=D7DAY3_STAHD|nr:hypothetical protein [Staphylothermus hellenicus]ADI31330.1 hypothetical protein Shell_0188 [Staphylothermus hellenicus DSM 12710]